MQRNSWYVWNALSFSSSNSKCTFYLFQKLVHKTYNKMIPSEEDGENGKHKPPNLTRLMKSRLEKLVNKTDSQYVYFTKHLSSHPFWPLISGDAYCRMNLCSCHLRRSGPFTTKTSRNLNVLMLYLYVHSTFLSVAPLIASIETYQAQGIPHLCHICRRCWARVLECIAIQPGTYTDMGWCNDSPRMFMSPVQSPELGPADAFIHRIISAK